MNDFLNLDLARKKLVNLIDRFPTEDKHHILKALQLATKAHKNQLRDEGVPFIIHPIRVAVCLIEELEICDKDSLASSLLHDVIEDTDLTLEEIEKYLGKKTAKSVAIITRDHKKETKYEKFKQYLRENKNIRAIKVCDRLDNMRSWPYIPKNHSSLKKFPRWFKESDKISLPLAESVDKKLVSLMNDALSKAKEYYFSN